MKQLKNYLNSLDKDEQRYYAWCCGTSVSYLRKAISIGQRFDGALARLLDECSDGAVKKQLLRPDIWPELLDK